MNKLKTIISALALIFMLLGGAASLAHAASRSTATPIMNSAGTATMGKDRELSNHHKHHRRHHRHWRHWKR